MFYFCPRMIRYTNSIFTKSSSEKINELVKLHTDQKYEQRILKMKMNFLASQNIPITQMEVYMSKKGVERLFSNLKKDRHNFVTFTLIFDK